jgi:hypothetical protein
MEYISDFKFMIKVFTIKHISNLWIIIFFIFFWYDIYELERKLINDLV